MNAIPKRARETFGRRILRVMRRNVHIEEERWALERVERVMERLLKGRPSSDEPFMVTIPWLELMTAFTTPDRYIFFSRRLYERCSTDEQVAFILAHEIAHHDLKHTDIFKTWDNQLQRLPKTELMAYAFHGIQARLYGPERECDADRHAIDLCVAAGYDGAKCLELFDILEDYHLDHGDHDGVYGPDEESDDELAEDASFKTKAQIWLWQRKRGYLPIRDRREMVRKHLLKNAGAAPGASVFTH